ncbi:MAG: DUF3108 domain-containing protein [Gammaproteobacteria bacterium]|nr:DUF3108 domain-containing protein [Gammaproteobacteria bacterium]
MSQKFMILSAKHLLTNLKAKSLVNMIIQACALPLCTALTIGNAYAFEPFQANYTFNIAGMLTGNATRTLSKQDDIWSYHFKANVASFANASEVSHFKVIHSDNSSINIQTLDHAYNFNFLTKNIDTGFKVDWANQVVSAHNKAGDNSYPAQAGMLDMLDLELQVREDIKHKQLKPSYLLADDKGIKKISFVNEGEEKIQTDAGEYDTVKIRLVQDSEKRKTYFWLAPKLDYLPVRVHQDDGNLSYDLNLTSYHSDSK